MPSTMPAIPGKVSVAPTKVSPCKGQHNIQRQSQNRKQAPGAVEGKDKGDDKTKARQSRHDAHLDSITSEICPDGALFNDCQLGRQRAGPQKRRQGVGLIDGKLPGNLPPPRR